MDSIVCIVAGFICKIKRIGEGKWKMTMGNKHVGEPHSFICVVDKN